MRRLALFLAVVLVMVVPVSALGSEGIPEDRVPKAVRQRVEVYRKLGVEVRGYVKGPSDLVGVVCRLPAHVLGKIKGLEVFAKDRGDAVFFLTPDGTQMFIGFVFDLVNGKELVSEVVAEYQGGQEQGQGESKGEKSEKLALDGLTVADLAVHYVETGTKDQVQFYCFVDLRCPYSRQQYREMSRIETRVRWVPITLGDPVSTTRASYLLALEQPEASDLEKAFSQGSSLKELFWRFGEEEKKALAKGVFALERNTSFAMEHGIKTVPTCLYVPDGRIRQVYRGAFDAKFIQEQKMAH